MRDLLAVNADLVRLGNLLKLELDMVDGAVPRGFIEDAERLHAGIGETQDRLKACAVAVADSVRPGRAVSRVAGGDRARPAARRGNGAATLSDTDPASPAFPPGAAIIARLARPEQDSVVDDLAP